MERLTERTAVGILVKENYEKESKKTLCSCYGEKPNPHYTNCEEGYCAMEKLADYEDAEEQGRLIKLPCKVGDDVCYILGIPNKTPCTIDKCTFELSDINKIGKTLFLTREEAEAKLKELRGVGNGSME